MASINIAGDTSGSISLTVPSVAGTNTVTIPASSGVVMVTGNMPAFSAYPSSNTTLTNATFVKVNFQTEIFDTNNNFASSRFTPTVAGYYQLNCCISFTGSVTSECIAAIYKNGALYQSNLDIISLIYNISGTWLVYANGSTDYFEVYVYQNSSRDVTATQALTWFSGSMVRSA
jgi:hypothetical protein